MRGGDIVQYFASFVDLTKHKEDEVRSRMLIDELNHRVKNTLSTVQSIVWQDLANDHRSQGYPAIHQSRLFALSRSHDLLTREKWEMLGCRYRSRCPGTIRGLGRSGGSHRDHG